MIAVGWQKAEGALVALAGLGIALAVQPGWPWWLWPLILLAPDLAITGYLAGPRLGAALYNAAHLYGLALMLAVLGVVSGLPILIAIGGLWLAHIGFDRALGYGLKSPEGFRITHLGRIGRGEG
ncbi:DUF4260 domain-containing protein [Paracoccus zhejiangensis]|uniref:DUF4260 domain-containing protein n=1 Tax=Paracoccus zhejiangensis TaxID=1077935 RepID=A0A2H5EXY3_9RHOB|nr:DUF4260 domain-containing protein [Paracoccus zhejiangensis]AUH64166.1 DUF4260 domain-containing protein [Paracoccus zhejiangensis]